MQARGTIKSIARSYDNGRFSVTIELTEGDIAEIDELREKDLSIELKTYRNPRSHSANAMLWACLGEMAGRFGGDKWDYYLQALRKYGKYTLIAVKAESAGRFTDSYRECEEIGRRTDEDGQEWVHFLCYFGSSTYDSKEFSVLLDGVIEDMKQAGMPTPTSEEMKRAIDALERSEQHGKESRSK